MASSKTLTATVDKIHKENSNRKVSLHCHASGIPLTLHSAHTARKRNPFTGATYKIAILP